MALVRIIKDFDWPNLLRQTPGGSGRWGDVQFTCDDVRQCDYALILGSMLAPTTVECDPANVWLLTPEPPDPSKRYMHYGRSCARHVLTCHDGLSGARYTQCQPALPWHVNRTYDQLVATPLPKKSGDISCVMSTKATMAGHRRRIAFIEQLASRVNIDRFGRGVRNV